MLRKYGGNMEGKGCNAGSIVIIMWCDGWAGAACNNSIHGHHHSPRRSTLDIIVEILLSDILDIVLDVLNCFTEVLVITK